ncbi:MAG: GNAT family N-acetyltransferase [Dyella sp.]
MTSDMHFPAIEHHPAQERFQWQVDGSLCVLDYRRERDVMTIVHTGVPAAVSGRGIAAALTRAAVDTARREGWKVRPQCSYAAAWLQRHAEYQELLA